jgi:RNA-directed DNA polymerase
VKDIQEQFNLPGVPRAKQGREAAPQWEWTEASVWTERMLATLHPPQYCYGGRVERGIKGGKWFSLIDKVWKMENLQSAVQKVAQGKSEKKADGRRCRRYAEKSHRRLPSLQEELKNGAYQPQAVERVWIPKLGSKELRPLGAAKSWQILVGIETSFWIARRGSFRRVVRQLRPPVLWCLCPFWSVVLAL